MARFNWGPRGLTRVSLNLEGLVGLLTVLEKRIEDGLYDDALDQIKRMKTDFLGFDSEDFEE